MTLVLKPSATQRESLIRLADWLVVGIAVALPWSTSATVILICVWAITVIPTIEPTELKQEMTRPAAFLPVALFAFAALGMLWADVSLKERIGGIDSFLKLLTIPLLMAQFRRSDRAIWALAGFLASGTLLLAASGLILLSPRGEGWGLAKGYGLPVKDYIAQSAVFTVCAFGLFYLAIDAFRLRWKSFGVFFIVIGVLFLADMFFVITSRTALLTLPFLLLLLGFRQFGWKGTAAACVVGMIASAAVWASSPNVRDRVGNLAMEIASTSGSVRSIPYERRRFSVMAPARSAKRSKSPRSARARRLWCRSIRTIRHSRSPSSLELLGRCCYSRCGSRILRCSSAAPAWRRGSEYCWSRRM
jgi:hypothetical protein